MTSRAAIAATVAGLLILLALIPVGRWERGERADEQIAGMRTVLAAVGKLDNPSLSAFRVLTNFRCLLYKRGKNPFALELCADREGRLVEAIDRRSGTPEFWSLRDDPTRSTIRLDRCGVDRLLRRMGVPERFLCPEGG